MLSWIDPLINIIYPDRCLFCRSILPSGAALPLCSYCEKAFSPAGLLCSGCERFYRQGSECTCSPTAGPLQSIFALSSYEQQLRFILHNLKYRKQRFLARPLGRWLGLEILTQQHCYPDLIVPVPLHRRRERERGFNQSDLIARHAGQILKKPVCKILFKSKDTRSQTTLSRRDRFKNNRGAFNCPLPPPKGSVVLLIDDIYSTGSTIKEAAAVLQNSGSIVHGAVIAYNPRIN
ncbi:MAG: ComF family protein [Bacillota bacterium]